MDDKEKLPFLYETLEYVLHMLTRESKVAISQAEINWIRIRLNVCKFGHAEKPVTVPMVPVEHL